MSQLIKPEEISPLLASKIDISQWGKGNAKTIEDLVEELNQGESSLSVGYGGILRICEVVVMYIKDHSGDTQRNLIELSHTLPDGRIRKRKQRPSGKIKAGETPRAAVIREVKEELGLDESSYTIKERPDRKTVRKVSESYPNLLSMYVVHGFVLSVHLPPNSPLRNKKFTTTEETGVETNFEWMEGEVNSIT